MKTETELTAFLKKKAKQLNSDWDDVSQWVIAAAAEFIDSKKPTEREKYVEEAGHYLCDGDLTIAEQVDRIAKWPEQFDQIDYVDGVVVWQAVENQFTCDAFLDLIGYVEN